jgi:uncharacterized lipoprotein YddW (UPF0748 family)
MKILDIPGRLLRRRSVLYLSVALAGGCVLLPPRSVPSPAAARGPVVSVVVVPAPELAPPAPEIPREFRGVWVAAVSNMDWPSRPGLPVDRQKAELVAMLDRAQRLGLNAVLLQVRPAGDALYPSLYEPWSEYLTGRMGAAPVPYYDPLQFAIEEAHQRGLELHAWFNPYRARHPSARSPASPDHISRTHPSLVRRYGTHLWMDPGEPSVQDHTVRVILDVVRRYDVDGIHIDDYFYPYREYDATGKLIPFPDEASYTRYQQRGGRLSRDDWRRDNVDRLIERLYTEIKREKPEVKFGISPFGIWRPGHPAQIRGLDAFQEIFADARKWLNNGWLDYFSPQLYWPIEQTAQSFPVLLNWWVEQNHAGRHIWPGGYSGRVGMGSRPWPAREIIDQIQVTRVIPGATGNVHFSMTSLMKSPDSLAERLSAQSYAKPALVPASPWLTTRAPARPHVTVEVQTPLHTSLGLAPADEEKVFLWAVRSRVGDQWATRILPGTHRALLLEGAPEQVVITAVGRTGNESPAASLLRQPNAPHGRLSAAGGS